MENAVAATVTIKKGKFPRSIPYIVGNEAAERFSFYGMKAILTTFMVHQFFNPLGDVALSAEAEAAANEKTHLFISLAYVMPLLGGLIADWFTGKYKMILYVSLLYCVGHACLAMFDENPTGAREINPGFLLGLLLIAFGAGGIKPCVSANVGDQFDKSNSHLISKAFDMFYFSINFGSFISTLLIPYIWKNYGASWAFGVPGILMGLATLIFWLGRKKYVRLPPSGFKNEEFYNINFYALFNSGEGQKERLIQSPFLLMAPIASGFIMFLAAILIDFHLIDNPIVLLLPFAGIFLFFVLVGVVSLYRKLNGRRFYEAAEKKYKPAQVEGVKSVWKVLAVFSFIPFFWALYDQNGSEWVIQAQYLDLHCFGTTWLPEQIQAINPILILLFIPIFSLFLYPGIESMGIKVTPLRKIGVGFVLTALSFVIIALLQEKIDAGEHPNVIWQLLAFALLTAGEVLISITGLEYAYTQAPITMKSVIMSFWLLTVSLGNILVSLINNSKVRGGFFAQFEGANYYWLFLGIIAVVFVIYFIVSIKIKEGAKITSDFDPQAIIADED